MKISFISCNSPCIYPHPLNGQALHLLSKSSSDVSYRDHNLVLTPLLCLTAAGNMENIWVIHELEIILYVAC